MTRRIVIECGVAETRAALLDDDRVWKFWFGPARGDETADHFPRAGRRFAGRVKAVDRALNAVFVDIGDDRDSYLALTKGNTPHLVEGAMIETEIKSPPRQQKGAVLRFIGPAQGDAAPGRTAPFPDAAVEAVEALGGEDCEIVIDEGAASRVLQSVGFGDVRHETHPASLFETAGVDAELSAAFDRLVPLPGGGRIIIDEAQALTAIDVDTAGLNAASPARLREKIGLAAARGAVRQVSLRNIGGHVVIDFPALTGETQRRRFAEKVKTEIAKIDGAGAASFSKSGLFSFTAPHGALSLLDRFCEPAESFPVRGARLTLEAVAKRAIRTLETRLRAQPAARFRLASGAALGAYLAAAPAWRARLNERFGGRFEFAIDNDLEERRFDLAEQ